MGLLKTQLSTSRKCTGQKVIDFFRVTQGAVCAIWGLGTVGISTIMACRDAGAKKVSRNWDIFKQRLPTLRKYLKEFLIFLQIIAVDINDGKLEIARKFGATHTINASE